MSFSAITRFVLRDAPRVLTGLILVVIVVINTANIVGRYAFSSPIPWAEETMVFLLVWSIFLGASAVTYDKAHLTMDLFVDTFPPRLKVAVRWITAFAILGVCLYCMLQSLKIVDLMYRMGQVSLMAQLPLVIPYSAFVVGFLMIALAAVAGASRTRAPKDYASEHQL